MPSLTDLSTQWDELDSLLSVSGGEVTPEIDALWGDLVSLEASKIDGYVAVIKHLEAHADAARSMADELQYKAFTAKNRAKWLKDRMAQYLTERGLTEGKGVVWRFQQEKVGGNLPIEITVEPGQLAPRFQKVTIEANKDALRAALESGAKVPGVTLGERATTWRIR